MSTVSPQNATKRRVMTSAIQNMSVAEVRKCLNEVRKKHKNQTHQQPLYLTDSLSNGMSLQEFSFRFQQGHYLKRQKGKS